MKRLLTPILFGFGILLAAPALAQGIFDGLYGRPQQSGPQAPGRSADEPRQDTGLPAITNRPRSGTTGAPGLPGRLERPLPGEAETLEQTRQLQRPERERNEFQEFVLQSTGRDLPLFGHDLFRGVPSTFSPLENVPVTPDYLIGPGDEILIRAWGQIDVDYRAVVDRNGTINVPKVGVINVAGIKYQDLSAYLKTSFGRVFRNFELTASLGMLRSIQIFVLGQARRPGTYTVSSLSTLVNAIFAAGGPSATGSMRSVQLKRGNRVVTDMDLYDLLVSGDKSRDAPLLPGDVIYFPPIGPLAAVSGSINVAAVYELKPGASLGELIRWAGGLATTAEGQRVVVERIENRRARKVEEFSLDATGLARTVRDGDLVTVRALVPRFENAVTLRGNVAQPGRFPWREGMRIRDLIPEKEALLSRDYLLRQNQLVGLDENIARLAGELSVRDLAERKLQEGEDVTLGETIRRRQIERDALQVAVPESGRAGRPAPPRLLNQIRPTLKEVNWDYALIERLRPDDLATSLVPFNLAKAVIQGDPQHNLLLQPGDVITIFSKEDLQVPAQRQTKYIKLEGEFASPGVYQSEPGETLRQLVFRVGGFSQGAYLFGSEFTRVSTRKTQESQYQETLSRLERESEGDAAARARNVSPEEAQTLPAQQAAPRALFARLRALKPSGRIVLELPESAKLTDLPDVALEDGDRFFVLPQPSMVNVFGAVFSEASFLYRPEKRTSDYLALAGGTTKRADTSQIFVLKADGPVAGSGRTWFGARTVSTNVMPGDAIVVPEDFERTTWRKDLRDWTQILSQFGLGAAGLKVLRGN